MIHNWPGKKCTSLNVNWFFDDYEENPELARKVDQICMSCPNQSKCLATGVSNSEWGVWGGIYLENGKMSKEFNQHKDHDAWFDVWISLTQEQ